MYVIKLFQVIYLLSSKLDRFNHHLIFKESKVCWPGTLQQGDVTSMRTGLELPVRLHMNIMPCTHMHTLLNLLHTGPSDVTS